MNNNLIVRTLLLSFIIFVIGLQSYDLVTLHGSHLQNSSGDSAPRFKEVNMKGLYTSIQNARSSAPFPDNYYDLSFKLITQAGMNHIRYVFYWEAYKKDPLSFMEELKFVSSSADKWGLNVIYDNHQFHTSSWLDHQRGTGFPSYLFRDNVSYPYNSGGTPASTSAANWWKDRWDRRITDDPGRDGWTLQAEFLTKIAKALDNHKSTIGYEILNEPQVHTTDQWEKIGQYNSFITNELRKITNKTIAFDMAIPIQFHNPMINVTSENMAKMAPRNLNNVVFKISLYGIPIPQSYQEEKINLLAYAAKVAKVPLYIGEWNDVSHEEIINAEQQEASEINPAASDLNQTDTDIMVKTFSNTGAWGWAFWNWNYIPTPPQILT